MSQVKEHEQTERVEEYVLFPPHEQRTESEEFRKNKHLLVHEMNLPCFKCMMKSDGWKNKDEIPKEAYEHREVHHKVAEWATWENVDPEKIQYLFDIGHYDFYGFSEKLKGKPVESPDDIRNLVVYCEKHHRGKNIGVHHSTEPEYNSDLVAKTGIDILLSEEEFEKYKSHDS